MFHRAGKNFSFICFNFNFYYHFNFLMLKNVAEIYAKVSQSILICYLGRLLWAFLEERYFERATVRQCSFAPSVPGLLAIQGLYPALITVDMLQGYFHWAVLPKLVVFYMMVFEHWDQASKFGNMNFERSWFLGESHEF